MSTGNESPTLSAAPEGGARYWQLAAAAFVYIGLLGAGVAVGGELGQIALAGLNALPFALLAVLAYLGGERFNWAWVATGLWLAALGGGVALVAFGYSAAALGVGADPSLAPGAALRLALVALGALASLAAGAICLLPPVRRAAARVIPIDPGSFVHAVALSCVVGLGLACLVPLIVLGEPPLLGAVSQLSEAGGADGLIDRDSAGLLRDQVYSLIWTIPAALLAVGYGVRRDLGQALARLGLVRPSGRQVLAGLAIALALAGAQVLAGLGIERLWGLLGWPTTDEEAFGELLAFAISPVGALVIGLTAGLGEELAVRGALQPRLGIILSNLFFTSLHALQYNWDALLIVFGVGLVCGIVRRRSNTSTAAIVHGTYNFTLVMLAVLFGV